MSFKYLLFCSISLFVLGCSSDKIDEDDKTIDSSKSETTVDPKEFERENIQKLRTSLTSPARLYNQGQDVVIPSNLLKISVMKEYDDDYIHFRNLYRVWNNLQSDYNQVKKEYQTIANRLEYANNHRDIQQFTVLIQYEFDRSMIGDAQMYHYAGTMVGYGGGGATVVISSTKKISSGYLTSYFIHSGLRSVRLRSGYYRDVPEWIWALKVEEDKKDLSLLNKKIENIEKELEGKKNELDNKFVYIKEKYSRILDIYEEVGLLSIETSDVSDISSNTAKSGGKILNDGGKDILAKGVVWGRSENPSLESNHGFTDEGSGVGEFSSNIINLNRGVKYYVRAYVTNKSGTSYGSEISFSTLDVPRIATNDVFNIMKRSAKVGGYITNDGGQLVTERGIVWSTSQHPTLTNNKLILGEGSGSFTSEIAELKPETTYYVRAYATNSVGTAYGNQVSFTTINIPNVLYTASIKNVTSNSAVSGGSISRDGGAPIVERGVVWSTSSQPTILHNKITNDRDTGSFTSEIAELKPETTYYVRAYATNNVGTAYGNQVSFTTERKYGTVTDIDNNEYRTVWIGKQMWMAENLRVTRFRNGSNITNITSALKWAENRSDPAWSYYGNESANDSRLGKLYNSQAVRDSRGLCPTGWRIPSVDDWKELRDYFEDNPNAKRDFSVVSAGFRNGGRPHVGASGQFFHGPDTRLNDAYYWATHNYIKWSDYTSRNYKIGGNHELGGGYSVRCIER